jgi:hypothetical protein
VTNVSQSTTTTNTRGRDGETERLYLHTVTSSCAASLEGVEQSKPVTDFVCDSFTLVERSSGTARDGAEQEDDTVIAGVGTVRDREGGVTEQTLTAASGETDRVQVQSFRATTAQGTLHGGLLGAAWTRGAEPVGVCGDGGLEMILIIEIWDMGDLI